MAQDITQNWEWHALLGINGIRKSCHQDYGTAIDPYWLYWSWYETADWRNCWMTQTLLMMSRMIYILMTWMKKMKWHWGWIQYNKWWILWMRDDGRASWEGWYWGCGQQQIYWRWINYEHVRIRSKKGNSHKSCRWFVWNETVDI